MPEGSIPVKGYDFNGGVDLAEQRPDLASRLRRAADHRFGEVLPFKILGTVVSIRHRRRLPPPEEQPDDA